MMMNPTASPFRRGTPFVWLAGGALAITLLLVAGMVVLILWGGLGFFWPAAISRVTLKDGRLVMGEIVQREEIPDPDNPQAPKRHRIKIKQGNRKLYGMDFLWIDEAQIASTDSPEDALTLERLEWGNYYGFLKGIREGGDSAQPQGDAAHTPAPIPATDAYRELVRRLPDVHSVRKSISRLERGDIGAVNHRQEEIRLQLKRLELEGIREGRSVEILQAEALDLDRKYDRLNRRLKKLREHQSASLVLVTVDGKESTLPLKEVVRAWQPNGMSFFAKAGMYLDRVWGFLVEDPRESNTEGGVFPAIFGTVLMVLLMSIMVTPFGVLAAFYLREYAQQGPLVSTVRIAVNNLAGVPSIVFGVFGVGFFIYFIGGSIDQLFFPEALPTPTYGTGGILWASLTLALMTVPVVIVSTEEGLAAIPNSMREGAYALGATQFEATWHVVLPAVMPSILTGLILAMARAAGEVAPLMITGVVKLAPSLPMDGYWPFIHLERKFMHLGFHIYDVGFQSPNVDAARPMVYTTTILLLGIVLLLNLGAIYIRGRLRRRFALAGSAL